jgi:hypothetical protein
MIWGWRRRATTLPSAATQMALRVIVTQVTHRVFIIQRIASSLSLTWTRPLTGPFFLVASIGALLLSGGPVDFGHRFGRVCPNSDHASPNLSDALQ